MWQNKLQSTVSLPDVQNEPILGRLIGIGTTAEVFEDARDSSYLFKKYDLIGNQYDDVLEMATKESELFNVFYGYAASSVIQHDGAVYLRMRRVPGIPLSEIDTADIPENLEQLYLQLICQLNDLGIIHYDLNIGNMLYDRESGSIFPIDFRNIYIVYYSSTSSDKLIIDRRLQMRVNDFYFLLNRKE